MPRSDNPSVKLAYEQGRYTDLQGREWRRGLDGWFYDMDTGNTMLVYHHMFVEMIERERPTS